MNKIFLTILSLVVATVANAQDTGNASTFTFYNVMLGIIMILAIVIFISIISLQNVVSSMKNEMKGDKYAAETTLMQKLMSLKPLSAEKDLELDHNYDGIKELNNPIPTWFNVLFYGTIIFAFFYLVIYHMIDAAPLQGQEYKNEIAAAKIHKDEYIKKVGNVIDENNVTQIMDASKFADAKKIFVEKCAVCHRPDLGGLVGPNLTDEYWLHGGTVKDLFKTIKYGVPSKGMVTWDNVLKPAEIQQLASYILSMQGSNPPNPKAPQGDKVGASTTPKDSTKTDTAKTK